MKVMLRNAGVCLALLCAGAMAQAQLSLSLNPVSGVPGSTVTFAGEIKNAGVGRIYLNDVANNLSVAGLTLNDSPFFNNAPAYLDGGTSSGTFDLFEISIGASVPNGIYTANFILRGGSGIDSLSTLTTTPMQLSVVPAPSAVFTAILGAAYPGLCLLKRRRRNPQAK